MNITLYKSKSSMNTVDKDCDELTSIPMLDTAMTFTDVFGSSGYTMVDKVKPL